MISDAQPALDAPILTGEDHVRANVYALLAAMLAKPPDAELLKLLKQVETAEFDAGADMAAAWAMLQRGAEAAEVMALEEEFHDLFIGLGRGELVPYGSWYLTGFLMEKPLAELRIDLQKLGFERQDEVHEPEDHTAALCETMSMMITTPVSFETQKFFFNKHISPWMPRFFADLTKAKAARFYRAVGFMGEKFLQLESTYLAMPV
ncbi:MAG TPA: molecular chaperone TorD family protein [Acidiferrobacterales bacterium]|nr:molecular chaperone TorD family protein [Acidiferrobacterales bacterium]